MPCQPDAHAVLFEQLRPRLTAISSRIVGSAAEAEDIVQDCYFKWRNVERAALATPVAWLTTVVQHHSIDRLRRRTRDALAAQVAAASMPDVPPPLPEDDLLQRAALAEALARLLACLSPAERLVLMLHEVFECEHAAVAAALGTTAANARQYLSRARRRLRDHKDDAPPNEKLCRELVRRFQDAINGRDVAAAVTLLTLLADEQPVSVRESAPQMQARGGPCTNDASYHAALTA